MLFEDSQPTAKLISDLVSAAYFGKLEVIRSLVLVSDNKVPIDVAADNGWTALMTAASGCHLEVVRYLVGECNASVEVANREGDAALIFAASGCHLEVVRYLVGECNASVEVADGAGGRRRRILMF